MGGLCGWLGDFHSAAVAERRLRGMAECTTLEGRGSTSLLSQPGVGLAVKGEPHDCGLSEQGRIWAAWEGRPRWHDQSLAALAERDGHARALIEAYRLPRCGAADPLGGPVRLCRRRCRGRMRFAGDRPGRPATPVLQSRRVPRPDLRIQCRWPSDPCRDDHQPRSGFALQLFYFRLSAGAPALSIARFASSCQVSAFASSRVGRLQPNSIGRRPMPSRGRSRRPNCATP